MGSADLTNHRRSSYFSAGCMSPSCIPVHDPQYSRVGSCRGNVGDGGGCRKWGNMVKKMLRESKSIYGSKPLTCKYDAVSYAQNFDEGLHNEEFAHCPKVLFREFRSALANKPSHKMSHY